MFRFNLSGRNFTSLTLCLSVYVYLCYGVTGRRFIFYRTAYIMCFINLVQYKYAQFCCTKFEIVTVKWPNYLTNQKNFRLVLNSHAVSLGSMEWGAVKYDVFHFLLSSTGISRLDSRLTPQVRQIQRISVVGSYPIESYPGSYFQTKIILKKF